MAKFGVIGSLAVKNVEKMPLLDPLRSEILKVYKPLSSWWKKSKHDLSRNSFILGIICFS